MFAGCIEFNNTRYGEDIIALGELDVGLAGIPYEHSASIKHGRLTLVEQNQYRHQFSKNKNEVTRHVETGVILAGWLRIDNRDDLLNVLRPRYKGVFFNDQDLVLAAYLKWGIKIHDHLIGDFALVIFDPRINSTFLIRDQIGSKPLYYFYQDGLFLFATSIAIIREILPERYLKLNQHWLASYLHNHSQDWRETPYQNILKVPPAHIVTRNQTKIQESQYFTFNPKADLILASDAEYVEAYREILDESIRCRAISNHPVGAESSGGMDSSTISVIAARHIEKPKLNFHTFGFANYGIESKCISAVSQSTPMNATHIFSQGTPLSNIHSNSYQDFFRSVGTPCEHYSPLSHTPLLNLANKIGVRTMMSGFGGDEFSTTFGGLARVELWESRQIVDWLKLFHGNWLTSSIRAIRWLNRYRRNHNQFETATASLNATERRWRERIIKDEISKKYSLRQRIISTASYDSGYTTINSFTLGNRWSPTIAVRLENSSIYAARYGIEYNWPLLDLRLIKFFLSVPAQQKFGPNGVGRYLHRRAIDGVVPSIISNKTKNMGPVITTSSPPLFSVTDFPHFKDLPAPMADLIDQTRYNSMLEKVSENDAWRYRHDLINVLNLARWLN